MARQEDHLRKICPKQIFPSDFVKLVSEILYLFFAEKNVVWFVCLLVATLSVLGLPFFN